MKSNLFRMTAIAAILVLSACSTATGNHSAQGEKRQAGRNNVCTQFNFSTNSSKLSTDARATLDQAATSLKSGTTTVEVGGHADNRGPDAYNMALSQRRADSVKAYLSKHGIDASRLTVKAYGETMPAGDNSTDAGLQSNRRVELRGAH